MYHKLRYTVQRSGSYHYYRRVPKRVASDFGADFVRVNIGSDYEKASKLSVAISSRLEDIWSARRVRPVDLVHLVASLGSPSLDLLSCADLYLSIKDIEEKPIRLAAEVLAMVAGNMSVETYTRQDARRTVEALLERGNKTKTVRRRLQSMHALLEFGYQELSVDRRNPFARLGIPGEGRDSVKRGRFLAGTAICPV